MLVKDSYELLSRIVMARQELGAAQQEFEQAEDALDYVPAYQRYLEAKRARKVAKERLEGCISDAVYATQETLDLVPAPRPDMARMVIAELA